MFERIIYLISFILTGVVLVLAPWLFGAWEMWWFWPFVVLIMVNFFLFSLRIMTTGLEHLKKANGLIKTKFFVAGLVQDDGDSILYRWRYIIICFVLFLVYAFIRLFTADVFMDAERSFLLFLTALLVALPVGLGFDYRKQNLLYLIILLNLGLIGLYGILNHLLGARDFLLLGGHRVLWMPAYEQYVIENRAMGSYYCPDHFSGIMEIAYAMSLGLLMSKGIPKKYKWLAGIILVIALFGVVFSKSRGGGLTIIVVTFSVLIWGILQWSEIQRKYIRFCGIIVVVACVGVFSLVGRSYMERFMKHFWDENWRGKKFSELYSLIIQKQKESIRGQMIQGAIRVWRDFPLFGVGPGMHQNVWFHYAASEDGDATKGIWPTFTNHDFHSYEVHSDWVQLLEEYGILGFILFFIFVIVGSMKVMSSLYKTSGDVNSTGVWDYAVMLGGWLACIAMAFHSLGDFNLQIPATVWILSAVTGIMLARITE